MAEARGFTAIFDKKEGIIAMTEQEKEYRKQKVKRLVIDFYPTEQKLVEQIEKQPKKQTYVKNLIREDIKKNSNPDPE